MTMKSKAYKVNAPQFEDIIRRSEEKRMKGRDVSDDERAKRTPLISLKIGRFAANLL